MYIVFVIGRGDANNKGDALLRGDLSLYLLSIRTSAFITDGGARTSLWD